MPKHIILTDVALELADVIIVPRTALPQLIDGLAPDTYTIRNTSAPISGVVTAGDPVEVAPTVAVAPSLLPGTGLQVGSTATLIFGSANGNPAPGRSWTLTRNGVDISNQVTGNQITFTQPGSYRLSVIWSNAAGQVTAQSDAYTVVEAPAEGVPPAVTVQPSFSRSSAVVGQAATLNFGSASGTPAPTRTWRLMRGTADVSSQVTNGQIVFDTVGTYRLEVTWTNEVGTAQATAATITVAAAPAWQLTGGLNELTVTSIPAPAALVLTGGLNEITVGS